MRLQISPPDGPSKRAQKKNLFFNELEPTFQNRDPIRVFGWVVLPGPNVSRAKHFSCNLLKTLNRNIREISEFAAKHQLRNGSARRLCHFITSLRQTDRPFPRRAPWPNANV